MSKRAAPAKAESAAPPPPPARPAAPSAAATPPVSRERLKDVMRADEGSADDDAEMFEEKTVAEPVQAPAPKKSAPREVMEKLKSVFGLSVGGATKADATKSKRVLRGRVVLLKDGRLSIEVVVDGAVLNWAPVGEVRLDLKSGGVLVVKVNTSLTTRAGQYQAGLQVMLVVDVPAGQHEISRAVVMSGRELIEIVC